MLKSCRSGTGRSRRRDPLHEDNRRSRATFPAWVDVSNPDNLVEKERRPIVGICVMARLLTSENRLDRPLMPGFARSLETTEHLYP